jgi:hypothetical protein
MAGKDLKAEHLPSAFDATGVQTQPVDNSQRTNKLFVGSEIICVSGIGVMSQFGTGLDSQD